MTGTWGSRRFQSGRLAPAGEKPPFRTPNNRHSDKRMSTDHSWKAIDARCEQLSSAVSVVGRAYIALLAWGFFSLYGIYGALHGDMGDQARRNREAIAIAEDLSDERNHTRFSRLCRGYGIELPPFKENSSAEQKWASIPSLPYGSKNDDVKSKNETPVEQCIDQMKKGRDFADEKRRESKFMRFPGGYANLYINDVVVVGGTGLAMIYLWLFLASRRENFTVRLFVRIANNNNLGAANAPRHYYIYAADDSLTSAKLVFSFRAVAGRFLLSFGYGAKVGAFVTLVLIAFPMFIYWYLFFWRNDFFYSLTARDDLEALRSFPHWVAKSYIEAAVLMTCSYLAFLVYRTTCNTSAILNGWHIATTDVWQWIKGENSAIDDVQVAPVVLVNTETQQGARKTPDGPNPSQAANG